MKLTKYGHACFVVEHESETLIVDPGNFTNDLVIPKNVAAVVITHEHSDHFHPDTLTNIFDINPNAILISLATIVDKMPDQKLKAVNAGNKITVGVFDLEFFGGKHATIHDTMPRLDNLGVFINNTVYYPGDSFALTNKPIDVLALPIGAPWLKISEVIDFFISTKPLLAFPTHDAVLSDPGKKLIDNMLMNIAENNTAVYKRIDGTTIEV